MPSYPLAVIQLAMEEASRQKGEPWYRAGHVQNSRIDDGGFYSVTTAEDGQIRVGFRPTGEMGPPRIWLLPNKLTGITLYAAQN